MCANSFSMELLKAYLLKYLGWNDLHNVYNIKIFIIVYNITYIFYYMKHKNIFYCIYDTIQ